jgi:hypothetical protein
MTNCSLTEEDVDAHESDGSLLRWEVGRSSYGSGDGYDELADGHAGGSHEEEVATSKLLDEIESREGRYYIDAAVLLYC